MLTASQELARFAAALKFADIPAAVVTRARDCIIDTAGAVMLGAQLPWGGMIKDYARVYGGTGPCSVVGMPELRINAPYAAMANGVLAHAYEIDTVSEPSIGAHPGATLFPTILAACEETGAGGQAAITAFVAGCEVMFRIGMATHYKPEALGFHQPSLTGCFGAAVAAGRIFGLNSDQLVHAIGIAGSLSSGLTACTKASQGVMVKRLHLGRAAESGIVAARLAGKGYEGPETVLEGKFGFLDAYCRSGSEAALLTQGLGEQWETLHICMKRYPCHKNAHTPVQALRELMAGHKFSGADVDRVVVARVEESHSHHNLSHHGNKEPGDIMQGQHSVPFCVALALFRNPEDPRSFDAGALADPAIRAACRKVEIRALDVKGISAHTTRVTVRLINGSEYTRDCEVFKGMPANPYTRDELRAKFMLLAAGNDEAAAARIFDRLEHIEMESRFSLS